MYATDRMQQRMHLLSNPVLDCVLDQQAAVKRNQT